MTSLLWVIVGLALGAVAVFAPRIGLKWSSTTRFCVLIAGVGALLVALGGQIGVL